MRKHVIVAVALSLVSTPVLAHHGHHHEPPVPPPVQQTVAPPAPPPPVIETPAAAAPKIDFQIPAIFQNTLVPIVPTDIAGPGGSLGHARGLRRVIQGGNATQAPGSNTPIIARDTRFTFTGEWIPFEAESVLENEHIEQHPSGHHTAKIEHWVNASKNSQGDEPRFMTTAHAHYTKNNNEVSIDDGAMIVRGGITPVFIVATSGGKQFNVKISGNALALVSVVGGKPFVLNMTDKCCGAVIVDPPSAVLDKSKRVSLGVSEVAEFHHPTDKPETKYIASKILHTVDLPADGLAVQVARCHYVSAIRKYNLDRALPKQDLNRVLKTAAAMAYVNPGKR